MRSESEVQQRVQIEAAKHGVVLMRNNSGQMVGLEGRSVRFGLGNISAKHSEHSKSSDLIGISTIVITSDMVGKKIGVFTAIEVKTEDWNDGKKLDKRETAQLNFIQWVRERGGIAGFVNSVDSFIHLLKK